MQDLETITKKAPQQDACDNHLPYTDGHAHLLDELRWLNRLLAVHVVRLRQDNFYENAKDFRRFFIADEEVDMLLANGIFEDNGKVDGNERKETMANLLTSAQNMRADINRRIQASYANNRMLPLVRLRDYFRLHEIELQALLICLAPQIDARYEKLYAYLHNDITKKAPSIDLILGSLCQSIEERLHFRPYFDHSAPLRYYHLIELLENSSGISASQNVLCADTRIMQYVLGNHDVEEHVCTYLDFLPSLSWDDVVIPGVLRGCLQKLMKRMFDKGVKERPIFYFYGRQGVGKKTIAQVLCGEMQVGLAVADVRMLIDSPATFTEKVRLILREGLLQPCGVYFDNMEALNGADGQNTHLLTSLAKEVKDMGWLTFFGSESPLPPLLLDILSMYPIEILSPDNKEQIELWQLHLNGRLMENNISNLEQISACFNLTGGQIVRAVRMAEQIASVRDSENVRVLLTDLVASSRVQSQPALVSLAKKIQPNYTWDDIVLPEDNLAQLREICQRVRHRHKVLGEWGFNRKLSQGKGVNALFAGPSGTGKTMAAEIIANELRLELYKIDLSGIVSKYIGETEKNLDRIFTGAAHSSVILFFDEADALFGKRSEVRDSHDRYANIEISYLLQKMEQYEGIAILATNLRQNLDDSFVRRLTFSVNFPFPDEKNRLNIWQGIWPETTPVDGGVDLHFLAKQFKLSGGNIKNAAMAAAFLAAENGNRVNMEHILQAIRREYQKMGKALSESDLGKITE